MPEMLVLYYSHRGAVQEMARLVARGIELALGRRLAEVALKLNT